MAASSDPASQITYVPGSGRLDLPCWIAAPRVPAVDPTPLVAVHGIGRGARDQAGLLAARANALGRPVIAPEYDDQTWRNYQQVVRGARADLSLIGLMQKLRAAGLCRTRRFDLAGYSGGAQFAHRFAMLYPHLVNRLTIAAAGWYTFPDAAPFPYGLGHRPAGRKPWGAQIRARLDEFLSLPIQVAVGAQDCAIDAATRSNPEIDRQQGANRLQRGRNWVAALRDAARDRGLDPSGIGFHVLPDCGHSFVDCVEKGGLAAVILPGDAPESLPGSNPESNPAPHAEIRVDPGRFHPAQTKTESVSCLSSPTPDLTSRKSPNGRSQRVG